MKKQNKVWGRVGMIALVLCLITTCLMAGTFAKYTSTYTGSATATVAKWSPEFKSGSTTVSDNFTVAIEDTSLNSKVTDAKIAPGTDGSFAIEVAPNGTEVAFDYTITVDTAHAEKIPTNLKFYSDAAFTTELSGSTNTVTGSVALGATSSSTSTIYWKWAYETTSGDTADTADGTAAATMSVPITLTATQQNPS